MEGDAVPMNQFMGIPAIVVEIDYATAKIPGDNDNSLPITHY